MLTETPKSPVARRRLRQAARARASIDHPNVLPARLHAERDGRIGTLVARCPERLMSELTRSRRLEVNECVEIAYGACSAVEAMVGSGLIPRDLNPDGIYVHPVRGALLADSGVPLELVPRPPMEADPHLAYRSPEELDGERRDERSVVYSLGAVLFASLTGLPPFGGSWSNVYLAHSVAARPCSGDHRGDVPAELDAVIARAMAVRPSDRYATARDLAAAVAAVATQAAAPVEDEDPRDEDAQLIEADAAPSWEPREGAATSTVAAVVRQAEETSSSWTEHAPVVLGPTNGNGAKSPAAEPAKAAAEPAEAAAEPAEAGTVASATLISQAVPRQSVVAVVKPVRSRARRGFVRPSDREGRAARGHTKKQPRRMRPASADGAENAGATVGSGWYRRPRRVSRLLIIPAVLGAGALVASTLGEGGVSGARTEQVAAGRLSLTAAPGWDQFDPPGRAGLGAASPDGRTTLVARVMAGPAEGDDMLGSMLPKDAVATRTRLGALEAARFAGLKGADGRAAQAYVIHTTGDSVIVICRLPVGAPRGCAQAASTLRLRGERPVSLATAENRVVTVRQELRTLAEARSVGRSEIANAVIADDQVAAASALAARYSKAADSVEAVGIAGPLASSLVQALRSNGEAYDAMAAAISGGDAPGYDQARATVLEAETEVAASSRRLLR